MRLLALVLSLCLLAINSPSSSAANTQDRIRIAAEDTAQPSRPALRSCSANSADRTQSCNVTCLGRQTRDVFGRRLRRHRIRRGLDLQVAMLLLRGLSSRRSSE